MLFRLWGRRMFRIWKANQGQYFVANANVCVCSCPQDTDEQNSVLTSRIELVKTAHGEARVQELIQQLAEVKHLSALLHCQLCAVCVLHRTTVTNVFLPAFPISALFSTAAVDGADGGTAKSRAERRVRGPRPERGSRNHTGTRDRRRKATKAGERRVGDCKEGGFCRWG